MTYCNLRIWRETNKKLKVLAALMGYSVIKLIDSMVDAEKAKHDKQ
ncbi:MAG: hypothetical protein PF495_01655 [Spirochaetales bacterium]|jgi:hypothetical protein|nr:hypothetical protein [Spirochaetales bacterium]